MDEELMSVVHPTNDPRRYDHVRDMHQTAQNMAALLENIKDLDSVPLRVYVKVVNTSAQLLSEMRRRADELLCASFSVS